MKAIETRYKGYRFRSRLEARWAVFFDAVGLSWDYEAEGFVDGAGRCYLPDFKLAPHLYFEVKPDITGEPDIIERLRREREKWGGFLAADPSNELLVFFGPPVLTKFGLRGHRYHADHRVERIAFLECRRCEALAWGTHGFVGEGSDDQIGAEMHLCKPDCDTEKWPVVGKRLTAAVDAFRGARFEHGESGAPPVRTR